MEELARTLEELGIQNVAPDQEPAGQTESSKRKKKKEKAKNGDKDLTTADSTEANGVTEEGSQQPAAAESAPEATEDPSAAEPEELVDPKEVSTLPNSLCWLMWTVHTPFTVCMGNVV